MQSLRKIIKNNILDEVLVSPKLFADVLKILVTVKPNTLKTALDRKAKYIKSNVEIANYLKSQGYSEEQIFEPKLKS